jgi:manganese/iron transport system permease protein/iron/zinc/copper transport system permease protein
MFRNYIHIDLMHFIMGDVLGVADADLWASTITAALVLSVILMFFRSFQLTTFDPVMAVSIGMPVVVIDYALTTCVSLVVVSAVSMVGVILVVGLLITPAATAYLLSDRLEKMMILAAIFGITSVIGGLYLCVWLDSSGGGAIMLFCTLQFLVVLLLAPRYGLLARWMRLRRMVPQQLVEDILGTVVRHGDEPVAIEDIEPYLQSRDGITRAVRSLVSQGLLKMDSNGVVLTDNGRVEATRILRAHRLWETYLQQVGTPEPEIHTRAHSLEHMHDPSAVDYLDDLLGHPIQDPHGQEIPEHLACKGPDVVPLSLLRQGRRALVDKVPNEVSSGELKPGDKIQMGARRGGGKTWIVVREDGNEVTLDHTAADAIMVKCE